VPGLRSSRTHVLDTRPDPRSPKLVRVIEADELASKAGYSRPHTVHCGPGGIFMSALGGAGGDDGPGGDRGLRVHQTRLQGGDASSDSYCFTS
jgi:selenium-binding protein 1